MEANLESKTIWTTPSKGNTSSPPLMGQTASASRPRSSKSAAVVSPMLVEPGSEKHDDSATDLDDAVEGNDYSLNLPDECVACIFQSLSAGDRKRASLVCRRWLRVEGQRGVGYVKLEELLVEETWSDVLSGELQKPYAKKLCEFVESEICHGSAPVYPPQHLIFNALNTTRFDCVKVVIIGQDPYHGPGQAMGLSFSVPEGIKVPSSLQNIYKELQKNLGCSIPSSGNLEKWAIQGVLLLNAVLTVRHQQANSHSERGWEQFTDAVIGAISQKKRGVVFLLWGKFAQAKSRLIDESKHHILKSALPSGLYANRGFFGCRHFSRTNQILERMGISPIDWQL